MSNDHGNEISGSSNNGVEHGLQIQEGMDEHPNEGNLTIHPNDEQMLGEMVEVSEEDIMYADENGHIIKGNEEFIIVRETTENRGHFVMEDHAHMAQLPQSSHTLDTGAVEEVLCDGVSGEQFEYDPVMFDQSHFALYEMYQPIRHPDGSYGCRICQQTGKEQVFQTRAQYQHHRYKFHGTFMHNLPCPVISCRDAFASLGSLKRHLHFDHKLPIETHNEKFHDINEFHNWRHLIESVSGTKFVMYNKQPGARRQVMHCSRSEHKALFSIKRSNGMPTRSRMVKDGACCPAHISYLVEKDGAVDVMYQMMHHGHGTDEDVDGHYMENVADYKLPIRPKFIGQKPMQYLQIDIVEMSVCLYGMNRYTHVLIVTDMKTKFMWARPLQDSFDRNLIVRLLVDIFTQFGVPEGYSASSMSYNLIRDSIGVIAYIFNTEIIEIGNQTPDYMNLKRTLHDLASQELQNRDRWAEIVPFAVLQLNQTNKGSESSPFELMFGRAAFPMENDVPPWFEGDKPPHVGIKFQRNDRVFMRNYDAVVSNENLVFGVIGEVDWDRPCFPYKIYVSTDGEQLPDKSTAPSLWVAPFDLAPTTVELLMARDEDRRHILETMLCSCVPPDGKPCNLFRAKFCQNAMSRGCCANSGKRCTFHEDYNNGEGDTYHKLQQLYQRHRLPPEEQEQDAPVDPITKKSLGIKERRKAAKAAAAARKAIHPSQIPLINDGSGLRTLGIGRIKQELEPSSSSHDHHMMIANANGEDVIVQEIVQIVDDGEIDEHDHEREINVDGQILHIRGVQEEPQLFNQLKPNIIKRMTGIKRELPSSDEASPEPTTSQSDVLPERSKSGRSIKKSRMFTDPDYVM